MKIRSTLTAGALVAALLTAAHSSAVNVAVDGTGGAIIIPYYTVDKGNTTLVTVTNQGDQPTAAKVTIREGQNGRAVLGFQIYLGAKDRWTAAILALDATGPAVLLTTDSSCTVPAIRTNTGLPALPGGLRYVPFRNDGYTGAFADGGDASLARTRQGTIEIIEMGTLTGASAAATALGGRDCNRLVGAWSGGYWTTNPLTDMAQPSGALTATTEIVDVAKGAAVVVPVTVLEGFRANGAAILHGTPGFEMPSLAQASEGIDAISATLLKRGVANEFAVESELGAQTEWIVTFPTKRYHTDGAIVGASATGPFRVATGTTPTQFSAACIGATIGSFGADGESCSGVQCVTSPLCGTVAQVRFTENLETTRQGILFGDKFVTIRSVPIGSRSGWSELRFRRLDNGQPFEWSYQGTTRSGLPAIGFSVGTFVNTNAAPGVLAVYARTTPHRDVSGADTTTPAGRYFENANDVAINDNSTVESTIAVSGVARDTSATIGVGVDIKHTYVGDLRIDLLSPDGSTYLLHDRTGGSTDNILSTYTVNASRVVDGTWRLVVRDAASGDTGFIDKWSLQF